MRRAMLFMAVVGLAGSLWAADPRVGTWKLNAAKSRLPSDVQTVPKEATWVIYELDADRFETTIAGTRRDGSPISEKWQEPQQGGVVKIVEPTPAPGTVLIHTVIGPGDFYSTMLRDGKQIAMWHWVVSKDLKTMLAVIKGTDAQGKPYERELLFDRQ
jgi:hypothetical protein